MMMTSLPNVRGPAPSLARRTRAAAPARAPVVVRAQQAPNKPPTEKDSDDKTGSKVDKVIEQLRLTGMTTAKARQILKTWSEVGVKDPEQLRKLLISRTTAPIPSIGLQALFDAVASFGGFYTAYIAGQGEGWLKIPIEFLGNAFGLYYFTQCLLDISIIGGLLYTTYKYGTNSAQLLAAVQQMAGPATGLSVVDTGARAVSVIKVLQALESVATILQDEFKDPPNNNSMRNLGAYLTLAHAKETIGFEPKQYGLTDKEAGNIAYAFSVYDTNSNYKLEPSELKALCASLGKELDDAEIKEAVKILDSNSNGYIDFNEFVEWWVDKGANKRRTSNA